MAKISHSDDAPSEAVHYAFGNIEFDIDGKGGVYETSDPSILTAAELHPWLSVEFDKVPNTEGKFIQSGVAPEDDVLSAINSKAAKADHADAPAEKPAVPAPAPVAVAPKTPTTEKEA